MAATSFPLFQNTRDSRALSGLGFDEVQRAPISRVGEELPRFAEVNVVGRTGRTYAAGADMVLVQMGEQEEVGSTFEEVTGSNL